MAESVPTSEQSGWLPYVASGKDGKFPPATLTVWTGGVVVLFLLLIATLVMVVPQVEARLARQTRAALAEAGIDTSLLSFSWNYRNLSVYGELPPGVEMAQLAAALNPDSSAGKKWFGSGLRQVRMEVAKPQIPVAAEPVAQRLGVRFFTDGKVTTLDGMVQTHAQRELLVDAALEAGVESINDNLDVIVGNLAIDGGDVKVAALAQMLELSGPQQVAVGQANLSAGNLTYRYTAKNRDAARLIEQASALTMVDFEVIGEMEYLKHGLVEAQATSDGSEVMLSGTVLSQQQQKRLVFAAGEAVGAANVSDGLLVSGDEPRLAGADKRVEVMANALALFGTGSSVSMTLNGKDLAVQAVVENDTDRAALMDALYGAGESGVRDSELSIREKIKVLNAVENNRVDVLQQQLDAYTPEIRKTVVFNTGETGLGRRARSTLEQVARMINSQPGLKVAVEGHTDNVGRASVNDELSQQRASAVREFLITQSVPAENLVAVGYGQRRPLESNDTVEGRQTNRRVHFSVLESPENE